MGTGMHVDGDVCARGLKGGRGAERKKITQTKNMVCCGQKYKVQIGTTLNPLLRARYAFQMLFHGFPTNKWDQNLLIPCHWFQTNNTIGPSAPRIQGLQ